MTPSRSQGLAPTRVVLPAGVTLLVKPTDTVPAVTISAAMAAGSLHDPAGGEGTAQLLSTLLDRGAGARSADTVADVLDEHGVSPTIAVTRHATTVTCDCLSEDLGTVLEVICDMLRAPSCDADELELGRGRLLTTLGQDHDSPATRSLETAMALLYGAEHPYGRRPRGTPDSVAALGRDAVRAFHERWYTPDRLTLTLVGHVDVDETVALVTRLTDEWSGTAPADPDLRPPPEARRQRQVVSMPSAAQADIVYGFTTIPRSDPAYHAYWLMNNVLGQYGIGGRLGRSIRERQGMAYYAGSVFEATLIPGPLLVRAGVSGDNVDRAVAAIDAEIALMAEEGATEDELASAKRYLAGAMPRSLETNAGIARFLQTVEQFGLELDYDVRLPALVEAVTLDDVADAARVALATDRAAIAIAGPYEETP